MNNQQLVIQQLLHAHNDDEDALRWSGKSHYSRSPSRLMKMLINIFPF